MITQSRTFASRRVPGDRKNTDAGDCGISRLPRPFHRDGRNCRFHFWLLAFSSTTPRNGSMSLSDSQRIPYFVRDGVLRINGALKYNDRELRLATMLLLNGSHAS